MSNERYIPRERPPEDHSRAPIGGLQSYVATGSPRERAYRPPAPQHYETPKASAPVSTRPDSMPRRVLSATEPQGAQSPLGKRLGEQDGLITALRRRVDELEMQLGMRAEPPPPTERQPPEPVKVSFEQAEAEWLRVAMEIYSTPPGYVTAGSAVMSGSGREINGQYRFPRLPERPRREDYDE